MKTLNFTQMESVKGQACGSEMFFGVLSVVGVLASAGTGGFATGLAVAGAAKAYYDYFNCIDNAGKELG